MADDSDSTEKPTRKLGPVNQPSKGAQDSEARVESLPEGEADSFPTLTVEAISGEEPDDEETLTMEREKILRQVAQDRISLENKTPTTPADPDRYQSERPSTPTEDVDKTVKERPAARLQAGAQEESETMEMKAVEQETREVKALTESGKGDPESGKKHMNFPARIDEEFQVVIPAVLARKHGLEPGQFVLVTIQNIDE